MNKGILSSTTLTEEERALSWLTGAEQPFVEVERAAVVVTDPSADQGI